MILPLQTFQPLNHANLKCLKKSSQIPGDWHLKPGEYMSNKTKKAKYFYLSWYFLPCKWSLLYSLVALLAEKRRFCFTLQVDRTAGGKVRAFLQTLLNLHFTGIRFELISGFPSKLDWYNSSIMKTIFLNCATPTGIVRQFYDFQIHHDIWKLYCETVSWVKLWELEGLPLTLLWRMSSQLTLLKNACLMTSLASSVLPPRL